MTTDTNVSALDDKTLEDFDNILFAKATQTSEHASCLVDFISGKSEDQQVELLRYLIENLKVPGRQNGIVLTGRKQHDDRYQSLARTLDGMIHGTMRLIIHSRKSSQSAAKMVRDMVFSFDDEEQRDYCLSEVMNDIAIPYRPIPQSRLPEFNKERLQTIVNENIDAVSQIRGIQRAGMETTTASELILRVLETIEDFEERVGVYEVTVVRAHLAEIGRFMRRQL